MNTDINVFLTRKQSQELISFMFSQLGICVDEFYALLVKKPWQNIDVLQSLA